MRSIAFADFLIGLGILFVLEGLLFAEAYGQDPDFFAFYRSMTAYENGLKSNDTRFLLRPDSDFFKFFSNSSGKPPAAPALPAAVVAAPKP